ncbi:MAG: ATP-grasp domain-containing protein [Candidatus Saccharimonadales bacterium]
MATIAILKGDKRDDKSEAFQTYNGLASIGKDTYILITYAELIFELRDGYSCVRVGNKDLSSFDLVYIRDFQGYEYERNAVALYLKHHGVRFLNTDTAKFQHISKLTQYMQFVFSDVSIPSSIFGQGQYLIDAIENKFGYPAIVKSITGNSGNDNFLVKNHDELDKVINDHNQTKFIAQEFIPNDGDLRVIVLGGKVECIYSRIGKASDHRNNISQGGDKEYLDMNSVSTEHKDLAVRAALALGREICGVDVMVNKQTNKAIILEANFNFGIRAVPGVLSDELIGLASYLHETATAKHE